METASMVNAPNTSMMNTFDVPEIISVYSILVRVGLLLIGCVWYLFFGQYEKLRFNHVCEPGAGFAVTR
jgi:hypothetical protein